MVHGQDKICETPTILRSGAGSGEEEVPVRVQAMLVREAASAPDVLSHPAARAGLRVPPGHLLRGVHH